MTAQKLGHQELLGLCKRSLRYTGYSAVMPRRLEGAAFSRRH